MTIDKDREKGILTTLCCLVNGFGRFLYCCIKIKLEA